MVYYWNKMGFKLAGRGESKKNADIKQNTDAINRLFAQQKLTELDSVYSSGEWSDEYKILAIDTLNMINKLDGKNAAKRELNQRHDTWRREVINDLSHLDDIR